jgi:hypothetical protein
MPQELLPYIPVAALVISIVALFVSGANLGWSVYKEVAFRARVRIWFGIRDIVGGSAPPLRKIVLSVTNVGPGPLRVQMIHYKNAPFWRRLVRRVQRGVILHDHTDPISGKLPTKLDVGESLDLLLPYHEGSLTTAMTHVGIFDSFGRNHWVSRRDVKEAMVQFRKDFPKK